MDGARTRGHAAATAAIGAMIRGRAPHAVLLVGAEGVGKTTLAVDLAAGLLCMVADGAARPCGTCRSCRLVLSDAHPDVHRLGPDGPGRQIGIGGPGARVPGIRDLIAALSLLPVEGGARVAIIASAQRMNEDAQAALLKTLEEPPAGVTLVLCADAEETLLPTIRSRCARVRLGPVATREIEALLTARGVAEPPLGARLARVSAGRPGLALTWAADPEILRLRGELTRSLLDLVDRGPAERLAAVREAAGTAARLAVILDLTPARTTPRQASGRSGARSGRTAATSDVPPAVADPEAPPGTESDTSDGASPSGDDAGAVVRAPATERRRAAEALVTLWSDVTRDVALCQRGLERDVRGLDLLDESMATAGRLSRDAVTSFLDRLGRASLLLRSNVSPELVLDDLAVRWPRPEPVER